MGRWFWVAGCWWGLAACGAPEPGGPEVGAREPGAAEVGAPSGVEADVAVLADVGAARPSVVVSAELKRKLVELSVAAECARREAVPTERAIPRLEALFAAQGVTLAEYSDAMAQLVSDREVHEAIGARLGSCRSLVEALWPAVAAGDAGGEAVLDAVAGDVELAVGDAGPGSPGEADGAGVEDAGRTVDSGADTREADTQNEADTKVAPKPAPSWSGTWVGALSGGQSGTLRVTVSGRTVTGAVATFGRTTLRLKGSLSEKGSLTLGGMSGDDFLRVSGRVDRGGQVITGTWDGVVGRKRGSGSLRLSR